MKFAVCFRLTFVLHFSSWGITAFHAKSPIPLPVRALHDTNKSPICFATAFGGGWVDEASSMQKEMFTSNPYRTGEALKEFTYGNKDFIAPSQPRSEGIKLQSPVSYDIFPGGTGSRRTTL
jgi:hypothetical protein